jgi:chaperonin GroES
MEFSRRFRAPPPLSAARGARAARTRYRSRQQPDEPDEIPVTGMSREVILIGDKVLIKPEEESNKTPSGLFLPQGVAQKDEVMSGYVVNTGPGYPLGEAATDGEPWSGRTRTELRYVPLQAQKGDFAIFLKAPAVEVEIDGSKYQIVPHNSILLLIRDRIPLP